MAGAFFGLVERARLQKRHAVVQGVRQDVGGCFAPRHQVAVVPDKTVAIRHGHDFVLRSLRKIQSEIHNRFHPQLGGKIAALL